MVLRAGGRETGLGDHRKINGMPRPELAAKAGPVPPVPRAVHNNEVRLGLDQTLQVPTSSTLNLGHGRVLPRIRDSY